MNETEYKRLPRNNGAIQKYKKQPRGTVFMGLASKTHLFKLIRLYERDPARATERVAFIRNKVAADHVRPFLERTP